MTERKEIRSACPVCDATGRADCFEPVAGARSHYNHGLCDVAFVFSAPGAKEECAPVWGATGINLNLALALLHQRRPDLFPHRNRYGYRITNAHEERLAKSRGDAASEAARYQILLPKNVRRVRDDLAGVRLVILCGERAGYLGPALAPRFDLVRHWHTSSQALVSKFNAGVSRGADAGRRRKERAEAWARDLLHKLPADPFHPR